jgi:hypothetical protein
MPSGAVVFLLGFIDMSEPAQDTQAAEDQRVRQAAVSFLADLAATGLIEDDFEVGEVLHGPEPDTMRLVIKARMTFGPPAAP